MSNQPELVPGSVKERIATKVIEIAKLPPQAPLVRGWQMFVSVMVGIAIFLVGCGILYAGLRIAVETKGGAVSLPILLIGALFCAWGGNHASKQLTHGGLDRSLSSLVSPIRRILDAVRGTKEPPAP